MSQNPPDYKKQLAGEVRARQQAEGQAAAEQVRADKAEREVRALTIELNRWKARALKAEAAHRSTREGEAPK